MNQKRRYDSPNTCEKLGPDVHGSAASGNWRRTNVQITALPTPAIKAEIRCGESYPLSIMR